MTKIKGKEKLWKMYIIIILNLITEIYIINEFSKFIRDSNIFAIKCNNKINIVNSIKRFK